MVVAGANSALIKVQVGKNSTGQLDTVFNPNQVTAQVGDMIQFEFMAKNHTATQSSFANPCTRQLNTALNLAGADSGFMPVPANATTVPTWTIQVNDASSPQWFFCNQANHCNLGMVFAINAPATGNKTFTAFQASAMTATHPDPALNQTAPFTPPAPAGASPAAGSPPSSAAAGSPPSPDAAGSPTNSTDPSASPTDAPANVAPGVYGSGSSNSSNTDTGAGAVTDTSGAVTLSLGGASTGTGTAAQDQGTGTGTLSGTAFIPASTSSRSAASRLSVGGGVSVVVFVGFVLGAFVL